MDRFIFSLHSNEERIIQWTFKNGCLSPALIISRTSYQFRNNKNLSRKWFSRVSDKQKNCSFEIFIKELAKLLRKETVDYSREFFIEREEKKIFSLPTKFLIIDGFPLFHHLKVIETWRILNCFNGNKVLPNF